MQPVSRSDRLVAAGALLAFLVPVVPRLCNAIQFVDGSGYLWIAPGCSSLANVTGIAAAC
ncbi:MAG: hypothetical protein ABW003_25510 [Microvirga sp.]